MRVEWFGQSAFALRGERATVFIDPFGDLEGASFRWEYPPIEVGEVDLLLVTHEHRDHNAVDVVGGQPELVRSAVGRHETGIGEVLAIASEHDEAAGTERGANTILAFELDGLRIVHFGDFGQSALRPEQAAAIGKPDLLFVPVGGGPTIGGAQAASIAIGLGAAWTVPMHYRTPRVGFLADEEEFAAAMPAVRRFGSTAFETAELEPGPLAVIPAAP